MSITNLQRIQDGTGSTVAPLGSNLHLVAYHTQSGAFTDTQISEFLSTGQISGANAVIRMSRWDEQVSALGYSGAMLGA
jgi:hypothetical protein